MLSSSLGIAQFTSHSAIEDWRLLLHWIVWWHNEVTLCIDMDENNLFHTQKNIVLYQIDISTQYHLNTKGEFYFESAN